MAVLRKRKFFVPVHFLVDLPELYQIQTVIERIDEPGGIDFSLVRAASVADAVAVPLLTRVCRVIEVMVGNVEILSVSLIIFG